MSKRILIVAAHPDDEVLGCGGTVARLVEEGYEAYSLILGEGIKSRYREGNIEKMEKELNSLRKHTLEANKALGIKDVFLYDIPDNRFDSVNFLDIVKIIEGVKEKIKPNIVFTHHRNDLNIDHRITHQAVLTAFRSLPSETIEEIYSFEVLSSTEWNYPNTFQPNVYFDISKSIAKKIQAMSFYVSELRDWPHPRSKNGIEILAKKRGCEVGLEYAEAFECIRAIRRKL